MKKPILMVGILFMVIFLFGLKKKGIFFGRSNKLKATSCNSVLVMLNKRISSNWKVKCDGNNLIADITVNRSVSNQSDMKAVRKLLYRELANNLIFIAKNSLNESLERTNVVLIHQHHEKLRIDATSKGKYVSKFATLKSRRFIAEHLQESVKVKEIPQ